MKRATVNPMPATMLTPVSCIQPSTARSCAQARFTARTVATMIPTGFPMRRPKRRAERDPAPGLGGAPLSEEHARVGQREQRHDPERDIRVQRVHEPGERRLQILELLLDLQDLRVVQVLGGRLAEEPTDVVAEVVEDVAHGRRWRAGISRPSTTPGDGGVDAARGGASPERARPRARRPARCGRERGSHGVAPVATAAAPSSQPTLIPCRRRTR